MTPWRQTGEIKPSLQAKQKSVKRGAERPMAGQVDAASLIESKRVKPHRVVRRRSKDWRMPPDTIYVGRPTVWGNPYVVGSKLLNGETLAAEKAVALYRQHVHEVFDLRTIRTRLGGRNLACWCALDRPCHADVLLELANPQVA